MDADNSITDVLSQNEVERLLAQVAEQEGSAVVVKSSGEKERQNKDTFQAHDFRNPSFLAGNELRKLRMRHEEFIRSLAARLSIYLRLEFGLQMSNLQTITYQKFTESLANPTHLTLFKAEPLRGICILDMNPRLGLTIVDRLMGGPANAITAGRDLTEIEVALLDQVIQLILQEWCNHWSSLQTLRLVMLGHESSGKFLQTAPHDTVLLALTMEARLGDCLEQVKIAFPYYTLEPLVRQVEAEYRMASPAEGNKSGIPTKWNRGFENVPIQVTAEWPNLEITARALGSLKVGDVLRLAPDCANQVCVRLADIPKFNASLGTRGKWWAVSLNHILKNS